MSGAFVRDRVPSWPDYADSQGLHMQGRGTWRNVLCVFHDDRNPSMRVNVDSGGWVCMSCGVKGGDVLSFHRERNGLDFIEAAKSLGAWQDDGAPSAPERPRSLSARDAMAVISHELNIFFVVISDIRRGVIPSDSDWQRFLEGVGRVQRLAGEFA